ncbi:hypothetical protein [Mycolicibacterium fortuitum]|uniref:hypothetical protein n=1 Tax=Mycolicibacterium fortuitum TaxID=1766 RepID=UPI003AACEAFF
MSETEVEKTEPSFEDRLSTIEENLAEVKRELPQFWWGLGIISVATVIVSMFVASWEPPESDPTNRDVSVEDLLRTGVHCYDSAEERAAARQRALAAIDRIKWDRDHPEPADYPLGSPGPPPAALASVVDTAPQGESWDAKRCFQIAYTDYY